MRNSSGTVRLSRFLIANSLSQSEAARRLHGVHRSHVCHWLSGRRTPTLEQAVAIERLTAAWSEGPIRPSEWLPAAPSQTAAA